MDATIIVELISFFLHYLYRCCKNDKIGNGNVINSKTTTIRNVLYGKGAVLNKGRRYPNKGGLLARGIKFVCKSINT